jgi:aminoglycoside phosphotransferase (APT) family kinase protein
LTRVDGASFAERMRGDPHAIPRYLEILAQLQARIHTHPADQLSSLKVRLATNIARTKLLEEARKRVLLHRLSKLPEAGSLCHGDFHPINVLGEPDHPVVIDWPDACRGDPAADVCRSYLLLKLHAADIAEPYLDTYCRVSDIPRQKIFDWLPYVAAARLAEGVPGDFGRLLELALW